MRFEQIRTLFYSLRFRLSAWNTAVVLLSVIATLFGVREALRLTLQSENDYLLRDDSNEVLLAVDRFHPNQADIFDEMDRKALGHRDRDLFVQLFDGEGRLLWSSGKPPMLDGVRLPQNETPMLLTRDGYRIVQRLFVKPGAPRYAVRVGASLAMINNDVATLTRLMTAAGVLILFIAPLSGYWLAGRATRPLARIITTAARLRPSHMDERLPIRGSHDELDQLSLTINHFLDRLGDYLQRNREFVANAAHELRSPLAAVQSSVDVTLNSERTIDEYQDLLCEINDQCGQLRVLVNQLLLLAETDARTEVDKQPLQFRQMLEKSIDMFRGAAEERGISLVTDLRDEVTVHGEADRLRQVVNNLIDNSLKFTPRGGQVLIKLRQDAALHRMVLRVADTGMGISAEELPHVFERFYRGDKSRQRENLIYGNGLGLSICKAIVQAHGGTITVESSLGRGTTFIVTLPSGTDPTMHADGQSLSYAQGSS